MSAVELLGKAEPIFNAFESSEGREVEAFDKAVERLLSKSADKLGVIWALIKLIDAQEVKLKARVDDLGRLRRHLTALRERLRDQATALLVAMEKNGEKPSIQRPEFSASLIESTAVEGPEDVSKWPEVFQTSKTTISANRAAAMSRLKAGEVFEGLKLAITRTIRFT